MGKALDRLKKAVSMKAQRRVVELPDGGEFEFWMTPLTLAERSKAQKQAKSDDATDFALQLLVLRMRMACRCSTLARSQNCVMHCLQAL
jgi:hypothetical protein